MRRITRVLSPIIVVAGWSVVLLAAAAPAAAQARVSGLGAVVFGQDAVGPGFAVSLGYDVRPSIGFEVEFGFVADLSRDLDLPHILDNSFGNGFTPLIFPTPEFETEMRVVSFSVNLVGHLGNPEQKLSPYVVVGGGTANVTRSLDVPTIVPLFAGLGEIPGLPNLGSLLSLLPSAEFSENAFMATVGGGVDFRITNRLSAGVDARYQHVFSEADAFGMTRLGGRLSFKF